MSHWLTHLRTNVRQRQPVELILHTGEKKDPQRNYPKSRDTFRAEGFYKALFDQLYKAPKEVHLWFPSNNLRKLVNLFHEYRNDGGVVLARVSTDILSLEDDAEPPEHFEVFRADIQRWVTVTAEEHAAFVAKVKLTGKTTLRLFFMIREFMERQIFAVAQLETRGGESSIPSILNTLNFFASVGKLQVPFTLALHKNEGKGVNKKGDNETHHYPTLSLIGDISADAQKAMAQTVQTFLELQVAPSLQGRALNGHATPPKALNAGTPDAAPLTLTNTGTGFAVTPEADEPIDGDDMYPDAPVTPAPKPGNGNGNAGSKPEGFTVPALKRLAEGAGRLKEFLAIQKDQAAQYALWQALNGQPTVDSGASLHQEPPAAYLADPAEEDGNPFAAELLNIHDLGTAQDYAAAQAALAKNDEAEFRRIYAAVMKPAQTI